jgi:hypothetical protein
MFNHRTTTTTTMYSLVFSSQPFAGSIIPLIFANGPFFCFDWGRRRPKNKDSNIQHPLHKDLDFTI